jgi:hypothetical protein
MGHGRPLYATAMPATGPDGRKRVDLTQLPRWAQWLIAGATVLVVAGLALWIGSPGSTPVVPLSAVVAGVIAFAFVAWRAQH